MQTPFERLAAVLDNASANYLSESQRQQQLADQRQYAAQQLADQRQYAAQQLADQRTYDEGLTNKNRAYEQEAALFKAGYLSKPVGKNTPEEIAAAAALAAQHALAIRDEEAATRKDTAAKRDHDAKQREREEQGWALNPLKSDERKAMEAAVDGGMINFGKPASKMTDEELAQANAEVKADAIKRADAGKMRANAIITEIASIKKMGTAPTNAEIAAANARNLPKTNSLEDRQAAMAAAAIEAKAMAEARVQNAGYRLSDLSDELQRLYAARVFPDAEDAPAALGAPVSTEQALGDIDAQSTTMGKAPAALGLDEEVARGRITEEVDKAWPEIESDYTLAALGDDAIREQINAPITRTRLKPRSWLGLMAASPYDPNPAYEQEAYEDRPNAAEVDSRRLVLRDKQKAARGRLAKRRSQFEQYVPKTADAEQMRRAQIAKAILGLTGTEQAVTQDAFNSVAPKQ